MASNALAGKGGSCYLPGTPNVPIAGITTWTCVIQRENYDATVLGDDWKEFVVGLGSWNGKITGFYEVTTDSTGQRQLYNALIGGTQLALQMQTGPGGGAFEGVASITDFTVTDPVNNLITIDFTYVGTGTIQHVP